MERLYWPLTQGERGCRTGRERYWTLTWNAGVTAYGTRVQPKQHGGWCALFVGARGGKRREGAME